MSLSLLLLALACTGSPATTPPPEIPMKPTDTPSSLWVAGPSIAPAQSLLAWLDGVGAGKTITLPVVALVTPLGVRDASIGTDAMATLTEGTILLALDDSRLGVSLADRLREHCDDMGQCAVWIEGIWGSTGPDLGDPDLDIGPKQWPFSVLSVKGPCTASDAAVVRLRN